MRKNVVTPSSLLLLVLALCLTVVYIEYSSYACLAKAGSDATSYLLVLNESARPDRCQKLEPGQGPDGLAWAGK